MTAIPNGVGTIETASGIFIDLAEPDPDLIQIGDIAHALAHVCRFGGHSAKHYSVAEHAVLVADRLLAAGHAPVVALAGLHHDDAEAYLGDIPRPLKPLLGDAYGTLTHRLDQAIVEALKLPFGASLFHVFNLKAVDNWACAFEAYNLMPSRGLTWVSFTVDWPVDQGPGVQWYGGLNPREAKMLYLRRHHQLESMIFRAAPPE